MTTTERGWHDVGPVDEVRRAGRVVLRVAGREIGGLVLAEGEALHAVHNRCAHHGAPLCRGTERERLAGSWE